MTPRDDKPVPPASDNAADVDLAWAPRDHTWSHQEAESRALKWADGDPLKLASVYLYRDPKGNPATEADYKFPVADIIGGTPKRVFSAVTHAAGRLNQAKISDADRKRVQDRITDLYRDAAKAFDDPSIEAPWES
ncbi:hypothetical protein AB0H76_34815 [Nocardia sp. NPDC050712]|uniref:hypothetical protein n=1 Tax=Nocardia sp. NPDC050712 TaxID=3155518 RepID=UPI0033D9DA03